MIGTVNIRETFPAMMAAHTASRRRHWGMIILATITLCLAMALRIEGGTQVAFRFSPYFCLPDLCLTHALLGIECPGCGLTRSFISLAHGDLLSSWKYHPLGWLFMLAMVIQLPYRFYALRSGRCLARSSGRIVIGLLITLLIVNWLVRMLSS